MKVTLRLKNYTDKELAGFIAVLANNGYEVSFRKGSGLRMMCDVSDDECVMRGEDNGQSENNEGDNRGDSN